MMRAAAPCPLSTVTGSLRAEPLSTPTGCRSGQSYVAPRAALGTQHAVLVAIDAPAISYSGIWFMHLGANRNVSVTDGQITGWVKEYDENSVLQ
jgi:hypothetical protein